MVERRSLAKAISKMDGVDPKAVQSFLRQDTDSEFSSVAKTQSDPSKDHELMLDIRADISEVVARPTQIREIETRPTQGKGAAPKRAEPIGLIPLTIRFRPRIAGALKQAALERELAYKKPFTQQGIAEEALEMWLREAGFEV
jgi:hypothetical protein